MAPSVTFVVPARDEVDRLPTTLDSLAGTDTDHEYEVVVVADRRSDDGTVACARDSDARVVTQTGGGIGRGRDLGAREAAGDWLAFVDADTRVRPDYLDGMRSCVERRGLDAASSRCRMVGTLRAKPMEWVINYGFPLLDRPVLTGFNFFVDARVYTDAGGFPDVPNEDTAFSRRLGREYDTGYCRSVLVESSGRRIANEGLTRTLAHYLSQDAARVRADYP